MRANMVKSMPVADTPRLAPMPRPPSATPLQRITFSPHEKGDGTFGERYAMVVLDLGTRWRDCFPSAENNATESRIAL